MSETARWETAVSAAADPIAALATEIMADFTVEAGGISWWHGQVDGRRLTVLSNYLLDALNGVRDALLDASLAAQDHSELLFADNLWLRERARAAHDAGISDHQGMLRAWTRGPAERRRERRLEAAAQQALAHLIQALDRLAAALALVVAAPMPLRRIEWGTLNRDLVRPAEKRTEPKRLDPLGSPGRHLQDALLLRTLDHPRFGPPDWLGWLRASRNAAAHRGDRTRYLFFSGEVRRGTLGMVRAFPSQPELTDVEALARSAKGRGDIGEIVVLKNSDDIVTGLLNSTVAFVAHLVNGLAETYSARRADPTILVQRGAQWQDLGASAPDLAFVGCGSDPKVQLRGALYVHPSHGHRIKCAHVLDGEREEWWGDYAAR